MLITGASGKIGSDLVKFFSKNHKVYALYRKKNLVTRSLRNKNIKWIKQDIIKNFHKKINTKIIIHCAGVHSFSKKNSFDDHINSNILGILKILDFARYNNVSKIFHISSVDVYGDVKNKVLNESNPYINPSILGFSKILMEKIISNSKIDYLNIRVPGVVGYQVNDMRYPWLSKTIQKLKENNKVVVYNGDKRFNNILDTVEIYKFIKYLLKKKLGRTSINLSASKPIELRKMIEYIKKNTKSKSKILFKKSKSKHFVISNSRVLKLYKFKPSPTIKIINRYINN